jgi:hypothetical protein
MKIEASDLSETLVTNYLITLGQSRKPFLALQKCFRGIPQPHQTNAGIVSENTPLLLLLSTIFNHPSM